MTEPPFRSRTRAQGERRGTWVYYQIAPSIVIALLDLRPPADGS
ncbi:hypothetical protein ACFYNN_25360 [Streptomyces sp. NPDC006978]|nr:hypothetical protein [Streptomyces sp. S584]